MADLISRAAAIEYLMTNMGWRDEDGYEVDDADEKRAIITDLVNGIPTVNAVPVVQRWISVKDRLPEVAGWYLVFYNGSAMQVAFFKGKKWPFDNHYHTITHWMPLPEPPKMDGESDG